MQISMTIGPKGEALIEATDGGGIERVIFKPTQLVKMLTTLLVDALQQCEVVHRECTVTDEEYERIVKEEIKNSIKDIIDRAKQSYKEGGA